jgi:hypothetical protein
MMGRLGLLAVMAIVRIALGGCAEQTSPGQRDAAATPVATGSRNPSAAEPTAEGNAGGGDRRWMLGSIRGLVTRVSGQPNGSHWITVEKDPGADCGTRAQRRGDPCEKWGLQILDDTVVLRGQGEDARPASPADIEEGHMVYAFPSSSAEFESYPPTTGADKVVILGPG